MMTHQGGKRARRMALVVVLAIGSARIAAQDSTPADTTQYSLAQCLQLAYQRQPRLGAARASLAVAEDGRRALEDLRIPIVLDPEIPVRRRQAELGVSAAAAGVDQAQREAIYGVTRTYYAVLYARSQERVTRSVVGRLSALYDAAKTQLDAGGNITASDLQRTQVYLRLAETKQIQAAQGIKRALASLREAIGLAPGEAFDVPALELPQPEVRLLRDEVIAWALARRGEVQRADLFAQIVCLEIDAQATSHQRKMQTFAAGGDIHAALVPVGQNNSEYRPAAVPPEMPTLLAGVRADRMARAQSLHMRAQAVAETTRNLIALEAEDAFLRWQEASLEVPKAREAAETGDAMAADLSKDFTARLRVKVEDVVNARVIAAQARAQYNEFLYRQILALADLERITAGGLCAGLVELAVPRPQPAANVDPQVKQAIYP